ncbi:cytochrome P450 [Ilyonectria destructans]|nr:cytochrome P450 [Ilyonectria destructans]
MFLSIAQSDWQLFAAVLILFIIFSSIRTRFRSGLRNIPGPWGDAPLRYRELHQRYGAIVRTGPNHVSVSDPSMIPVIYGIGRNFKKTSFYKALAPIYQGTRMDSLFSERDPQTHKALKSPVAQIFSMTNIRNFEPYADECTGIFMDAMRDLEGQAVDFAQWLQWYAFDVIGSITFQRRFGFMEQRQDIDDMIKKINDGLEYVKVISQFESLIAIFGMLSMNAWISPYLMPDTMHKFMQITQAELDKYDNGNQDTGRTDFLSQLREKQKKSGKISSRDMMNHLSNNLLAGSDTTGISLRAILYYVVKSPRILEKLVNEIDEADSSGNLSTYITYEECLKLPYLQATIKEAMRIHPAVGFPLERYTPPEGAEICGYMLPAGTNVSMSAPVIHLNKDVFGDDADEFVPERWLEASPGKLRIMDRSFLAFGYGSRTCIGKNISIMEMGKFVPQILRHFEIQLASDCSEWKIHAAWFWKQSNLVVKVKSRKGLLL